MNDLKGRIHDQKRRLDALRPLAPGLLTSLREFYDIEITYTSNAIEGNTLTLRETAEVIQHGITVGGKKLTEHLEATDHYKALQWMRGKAEAKTPLDEAIVLELHRRVVLHSTPEIAGQYSEFPRRIAGSAAIFPNPAKVPFLMSRFGDQLSEMSDSPEAAFDAHFQLVRIHPFADGNGRTARLLMNLMLIRGGYAPVAVRLEDRSRYLDTLETGLLSNDLTPFQILMHERLEATMADYLGHFEQVMKVQQKRQLAEQQSQGRGR